MDPCSAVCLAPGSRSGSIAGLRMCGGGLNSVFFGEHNGISAHLIGNFHQNHIAALVNGLKWRVEASGVMDCVSCEPNGS